MNNQDGRAICVRGPHGRDGKADPPFIRFRLPQSVCAYSEARRHALLVGLDAGIDGLVDVTITAQESMRDAGFVVADHMSPLDMVLALIAKIKGQQTLEAALRERLKAAEGGE